MAESWRSAAGRVHSVETFGALDGPGIRYVVFLQGCPLRCAYCHNPDSWRPDGGHESTAGEVVDDILSYRSFIRSGGVTLSGGEPLMQPAFTAAILEGCREKGLHTAIDTSGAVDLSLCSEAVDSADLLLLDIKAADPELCRKITGKTNKNALEVLRRREAADRPVWIRHVLVPGLTLEEVHVRELGELLEGFRCIERVELLPFHKMGEYKWRELNLPYKLWDTPAAETGDAEHAAEILRSYGLNARV